MSSYAGRHAELYDTFYADKPYDMETEFIQRRFNEIAPTAINDVLDVACGTGRHALSLTKQGYKVVGIDHSEDMLARARARAAEDRAEIEFYCRDMCDIDLGERRFDAAVCLFDSIGYAKTTDGVLTALRSVRDHLRPAGLFVVEYWHAPAMLRHYDPVRVRRWRIAGLEIERTSETTLNPSQGLAEVRFTVREWKNDRSCAAFTEIQTNRFFSCEEMDQLLRRSGFEPIASYAAYDECAAITDDTWHIVAIGRRA